MAKRIRHDRCYHPNDKATRDACAQQQREYNAVIESWTKGDGSKQININGANYGAIQM